MKNERQRNCTNNCKSSRSSYFAANPFRIVALIIFLTAFGSCTSSRYASSDYISRIEAKYEYNLSSAELETIRKKAKAGEIDAIYHGGRDQWLYKKSDIKK